MKYEVRLLSFAIIAAFTFNSFASVVSDNDGTTFVTKAEFDSLKNSFSKQIDDYNLSIDSKIDGAIASYLAGISISKVEELSTDFNEITLDGATVKGIKWGGSTTAVINSNSTQGIGWAVQINAYESGQRPNFDANKFQFGMWQQQANKNTIDDNKNIRLVSSTGALINGIKQKSYYLTGNAHVLFVWNWDSPSGGSNKTIDFGSEMLCYDNDARQGKLFSKNTIYTPNSTVWQWGTTYYDNGTTDGSTAEGPYCVSSTLMFGEKKENITDSMKIWPLSDGTDYVDNESIKKLNWTNTGTVSANTYLDLSWGHATGTTAQTSRLRDALLPINAKINVFEGKKSKELQYECLNKRSEKQGAINKGVWVCEVPKKGTVKVSYHVDKKGWVFFWLGNSNDIKWGDNRTSETDTSWKVTSNTHYVNSTSSVEYPSLVNDESNNNLWVMYIPDDTTTSTYKLTLDRVSIIFD